MIMRIPDSSSYRSPHIVTSRNFSPLLASVALLAAFTAPAHAMDYYVDPATGSMSNPGSAASPWSTLQAVFAANKTFAAGDVIHLRSGYHGTPEVKGTNAGYVTIQPDGTAVPTAKKLVVKSGSRWIISGLDISPENTTPITYGGTLVDLQSTATYVIFRNCRISFSEDTSAWTVADWQTRAGTAISAKGQYTTIAENDLINVGFGINVNKTATNAVISRNLITNFSMDAMRALADYGLYEYNTVTNSYVSDDNHDDFLQSWSTNAAGTVGAGTVRDVTVRGNIFISNTDPGQPFPKPPQGVGCFDGMFENWVVENNVISSKTYHGIAFYGAINCKIINNTVVENAVNGSSSIKPWVKVYEHKANEDGTPWPVISSGNVIRNNISSSAAGLPATAGVKDHNLTTTSYATCFTNYAAFDFYPLATSPAVGAGDSTGAPSIDILGNPREIPYDVGAFEYVNERIVDNTEASAVTLAGAWIASTSNAGYYGSDYLHDNIADKGSKSVSFTPALGTGSYDVYMRWTSGANRATNVPVRITHSTGISNVTVNQRNNNGTWILLGTYNFNPSTATEVRISNTGTDGHVIADAVRWVRN